MKPTPRLGHKGAFQRIAADITVAIPTMDRPGELLRCLEAIASGDALPGEVVVIDQSASGETRDLLRCRSDLPFELTYRRIPPAGLSRARNLALTISSRAIMAFTDDDCVPDSGWLGAVADAFSRDPAPAAVTGRILPLGDESVDRFAVSVRSDPEPRECTGRMAPWRVGSGGNTAVRRTRALEVAGFDARLGPGSAGQAAEDIDFLYRLITDGALVRYEPRSVVFHERQTLQRRLATRSTYGFGAGAFCGLRLREGDQFAPALMAMWMGERVGALVRAICRGRLRRAREELLLLRGAAGGMVHGLRCPPRRALHRDIGAARQPGVAGSVAASPSREVAARGRTAEYVRSDHRLEV